MENLYDCQHSWFLKTFLGLWIAYYIYMMLNGIVIPKGSAVALIFSCIVFVYIVYCNIFANQYINKFILIYLYLIYIAFSIFLLSSNYFASYRLWVKYSNGLLCLPIAFNLVSTNDAREKVMKITGVFVVLFILNYALANIFHLGGSRYGTEEGIETGNLFDEALYLNVCALIIFPYIFSYYYKKFRILTLVTYALNIAITIVCLKRTVILCIVMYIFLFTILYRYFNKGKQYMPFVGNILSRQQVIATFVSILIFGSMFAGLFMNQLNARGDRIGADLSSETRTQELELIVKDIVYNTSDKIFFLGKETFNTVGTYAGGAFGRRMIHENYGIMLNGGGIIGLSFYIIINLWILYLFLKYTKNSDLSENLESRLLYIAFICLWVIFLIASFSGTIWLTIYPAITHTLQGVILRYFHDGQE